MTRKTASGIYILKNKLQETINTPALRPEQGEENTDINALLYIILGLIFINKSGIEKDHLDRCLASLKVDEDKTWIDNTIEKVLVKQLYLEKIKSTSHDGKDQVVYYMGARAEIEIGKIKLLECVAKVCGDTQIDPILLKEVQQEVEHDMRGIEAGEDEGEGATQASQGSRGRGGRGKRGGRGGRGGRKEQEANGSTQGNRGGRKKVRK